MRNSEVAARRIIEKEIGLPVVQHDDNSESGMYDLRIGAKHSPVIAIECVGAVDPVLTETWNIGPAKGPFQLPVPGDWEIIVIPGASVRKIKKRLSPILHEMVERNLVEVDADYVRNRDERHIIYQLRTLGICGASCFRTPGIGQIHLGMEGTGGPIDSTGASIPGWIEEFLRHPERADVLLKLNRSGATENHVFVHVEFGGAPWSVQSYLLEAIKHLPEAAPDLPAPVTGVWVASTQGRYGVRWTNSKWWVFDTRAPDSTGID
ncbi:MAG TPA: hypothetical protein VF142_00890 [Longimicrobium sp.]